VLILALLLSALAVGLDNFAAAIGIGLAGVGVRARLRVAVVFGLFEAGMPVVGILIGHSAEHSLGRTTRYVGGALLVAVGLWTLMEARRADHVGATDERRQPEQHPPPEQQPQPEQQPMTRLILTALGLSIDNLVVGFGLGVTKSPLAFALVVFAVVSVGLTLAGLEVGRRLGARLQRRSDEIAAAVLIVVGILVGANVL
jgi:putative Mn2+ efflux pump MntP